MNSFIYSWNISEDDIIYAFAKNENGRNVLFRIPFNIYCYVLLPSNIEWNEFNLKLVIRTFKNLLRSNTFRNVVVTEKYRLFGAHVNPVTKERKKFLFLKCFFKSKMHLYIFRKLLLENNIDVGILGNIKFKLFEDSANQILQLCCNRHLDTIGWVNIPSFSRAENSISLCDEEYIIDDWTKMRKFESRTFPPLLCCSFDIECVPENRTKFPNSKMPNDICFQISCVLFELGNLKQDKYLLTLSKGDLKDFEDVKVIQYTTEAKLLCGFSEFLRIHKVNICMGYNIFTFDIPYLIERSKQTSCFDTFYKQGFLKFKSCKIKNIKWSSSAYQVQEYTFLDNEGRIFIDLLPIIQKEYKLENYKLDTVGFHFLKEKKNDLKPEDINRCFDEFSIESLTLCGKYCVQDSILVANLFTKLQIFYSLHSMANICRVPVSTLLLYGQQIKVYSSIYQYCTDNGFVVEKPDYRLDANERYTGAYVFDPIPGLYENVVPFDFASLYPTTIIAYNIDYSTIVFDDFVPDEDCHVMEWQDHVGCIHDKKILSKSLCQNRKYRFLKEPKGVLPTIISELLEKRKATREELKIATDPIEKLVLNQRQLAYKTSANSMYGITGVKQGLLPLMPLAMCTTFKGRENVLLAAERIKTIFGGNIVYGDTDSNYITFNQIDVEHLYEFGFYVANEISKTFPYPIKLEFEDNVYKKFLIFTKKRYVYQQIDRNGIISNTIGKTGVLLCRRDTCKFIQNTYNDLILMIFNKENKNCCIQYINERIILLLTRNVCYKELIMTKSFNDFEGEASNGKLGNYKVKMCDGADSDYYIKQLPGMCQLVERIRKRGDFKFEGRRLEYLMLETNNPKHKQGDKMEHVKYFEQNREWLKIDYSYYIERLIEPIDQIFSTIFNLDYFVKDIFKFHYKFKLTLTREIKNLNRPILIFKK